MSEIKEIAVTIERSTSRSPGRVTYGRFVVENGKVVMYDENDKPMMDRRGNRYEAPVASDIPAEQIAARLTKKIRQELTGDNAGFNRHIDYRDGPLV